MRFSWQVYMNGMLKTDVGMFDLPKLTAHRLSAVHEKDGKMKRMREPDA